MQQPFRLGDNYHVEPSLNRVTGPKGAARLEPKVMSVLVCLATRAGEMVPKDRLMGSVWADTAVGDDVLTRAISELRRLFEDDPKQPHVIETIPRAGYRLVAPVAKTQPPQVRPADALPPRRNRPVQTAIVVSALLTIVAIAGFLWSRRHPTTVTLSPRVVSMTMLHGMELSPTFSPDGAQVAFSWNGEKEDNFDIYLKFVGSSEIRRVTTDPAADVNPAWSPDGRQIAFVRERPDDEGGPTIQIVSPLGGADRRISNFRVSGRIGDAPDAPPLAWSPDSRWVAASRQASRETAGAEAGLYLIPVSGGEPRPLTRARRPDWHTGAAFSPDGRHLAYASCSGVSPGPPACDVHEVELGPEYSPAAAPRRLTTQGFAVQGLAWTRDGSSIIYDTTGRGPHHVWRVTAHDGGAPARIEIAGAGSRRPASVPSRDRLAFERRLHTLGVYRVWPGHAPQPVLVSPAFDFEPQFSPDGRRLAFSSRRSGDTVELWTASADGSSPQQLTRGPGPRQGAPAWSPDGRQIAFESMRENGHWDIWVMDVDGSARRQLTMDPGDEHAPTWSGDGREIYFSSNTGGGRDIWRAPVAGGPPQRVTRGGSGAVAYEAPEGKAILYQTRMDDSPLVMLPLAGGPPRQLVGCVKGQGFVTRKGAGIGGGVYYAPCGAGPQTSVHLLDPATGRDRVVANVSGPFFVNSLAVSPDGNTILVHRGAQTADLVLIENFQ